MALARLTPERASRQIDFSPKTTRKQDLPCGPPPQFEHAVWSMLGGLCRESTSKTNEIWGSVDLGNTRTRKEQHEPPC